MRVAQFTHCINRSVIEDDDDSCSMMYGKSCDRYRPIFQHIMCTAPYSEGGGGGNIKASERLLIHK